MKRIAKCDYGAFEDEYAQTYEMYLRLRQRLAFDKDKYDEVTISKEPFGQMYRTWEFYNTPFPTIIFMRRVRMLSESGLANMWNHWKFLIQTWNGTAADERREQQKVKATSLDGNYVTVFYVFLTFLVTCSTGFAIEQWQMVVRYLRNLWKILCKRFHAFKNRVRRISVKGIMNSIKRVIR